MENKQYLEDAKGRMVPVTSIKEIDLARNDLVLDLAQKAEAHNASLVAFKAEAFEDVLAFMDLSAEQYNVTLGGKKGNVSLTSYKGDYKVQVAVSEYLSFDERLQVAKALIDKCIHTWSQGANENIKLLVDDAFQVDKEGNVSIYRILGLRKFKIDDADWQAAMQAITDSINVTGSKKYVRIYKRDPNTDEYKQIPLNIAAV